MSIYPVRLHQWYYPRGARDAEEAREQKHHYEVVVSVAKTSVCCRCGKPCKATSMIADHSLPWGYYGEVWCSTRCYRRKARTRYFERARLEERFIAKISRNSMYGRFGGEVELNGAAFRNSSDDVWGREDQPGGSGGEAGVEVLQD